MELAIVIGRLIQEVVSIRAFHGREACRDDGRVVGQQPHVRDRVVPDRVDYVVPLDRVLDQPVQGLEPGVDES